jgi:transcriptional regulator with XRE-family HTH domain
LQKNLLECCKFATTDQRNFMNKFADTLKRERVKNKMTIGKFARHLGVERSLYFRWENGSVTPRYDNLKKISESLGLDMNDLF